MKRSLVIVITLFCCLITCLAISTPAYAGEGSFVSTCQNIKIDEDVLEADCLTYDKDWRTGTQVRLNGIQNEDGELTWNVGHAPDYYETCVDIGIDGDLLSAKCKNRNGEFQDTSIRLIGIINKNGYLNYDLGWPIIAP